MNKVRWSYVYKATQWVGNERSRWFKPFSFSVTKQAQCSRSALEPRPCAFWLPAHDSAECWLPVFLWVSPHTKRKWLFMQGHQFKEWEAQEDGKENSVQLLLWDGQLWDIVKSKRRRGEFFWLCYCLKLATHACTHTHIHIHMHTKTHECVCA